MLITLWGKEKELLNVLLLITLGRLDTVVRFEFVFAHLLKISLSDRGDEDAISLDKRLTWNRLDQQSCRKDLSLLQLSSSFDCVLN